MRGFFLKWMLLSLAFHLAAAYFSIGYHSADEYFQILEFLNFRLGRTAVDSLAVEYAERMRPWMQPWLYGWIAKAFQHFGFDQPFIWATSFRVFTGVVGWASTWALTIAASQWFESERAKKFLIRASSLLWFLPALHVRPSSESLGGSVFLLGLALVIGFVGKRKNQWIWLICGLFWGLSFEFRFQMGVAILGGLAWLLCFGGGVRTRIFRLSAIVAGMAFVFCLGRVVDYWGYGEWVLTPWRYFSYNLVRGEVYRYNLSPWWDIARMSLTEAWPLLGVLVLVTSILAWIRWPLNILTWCHVPFFLIHLAIAHKELRFFFPLAEAAPVLLTMSLSSTVRGILCIPRMIWALFLINDLTALVVLSTVPASRNVQFYQAVWNQIPSNRSRMDLLTMDRNPYEVLGTETYYYRPPELRVQKFRTWDEFKKITSEREEPFWLFWNKLKLPLEAATSHCRAVFKALPEWLERWDFQGWLDRTNAWSLYRCDSSENTGDRLHK